MNDQDEIEQQPVEELAEFRQRVAESEVFRRLFQDSVVGTVVATPNGSVVQANKAFCSFLGYSELELVLKQANAEGVRRDVLAACPVDTITGRRRLGRSEVSDCFVYHVELGCTRCGLG